MPRIRLENLGLLGLVRDLEPYALPVNAWSGMLDFRAETDGMSLVYQPKRIYIGGEILADIPTWWMQYGSSENPLWLTAITESAPAAADGLLKVGGPGLASPVPDVTRASSNYSTKPNVRPQGFTFQGVGIFNNAVDIPQYWAPIATGTLLADFPNWSTNTDGGATVRPTFMRPHKNFIIYGNFTSSAGDFPYRVRWSDAAVPGSMPSSFDPTDATKLGGDFDFAETSDYVVDGLTLNETFMVYKERSTWGMQFTGSTFRRWKIFDSVGILARDCVAAFPGGHFVVGQNDIYVHNGTPGSAQSILSRRMQRTVFAELDGENAYNSYVVVNSPDNEIWFCYPDARALTTTIGGVSQKFASVAVTWNWQDGSIGFRELYYSIPWQTPGPLGADSSALEPLLWG